MKQSLAVNGKKMNAFYSKVAKVIGRGLTAQNRDGSGILLTPKDKTKNLLKDRTCDNCGAAYRPCHSIDRTCKDWVESSAAWTVEFKEAIDQEVIKNLQQWMKLATPEQELWIPSDIIEITHD
jgi:hypothetical protein